MKIFPFSLLMVTLSKVALAQPAVVDDFTPRNQQHDFEFGSSEYVNRSFVRVNYGTLLGEERDVEFFQELPTNPAGTPRFHTMFTEVAGQDYYSIGAQGPGASLGRARGYIEFQYDRSGDEDGNTGFDRHLNNVGTGVPFFFGDYYGFRIRHAGRDLTIPTTVTIRNAGVVLATVTENLGGTSAFREQDFLLPTEQMRLADSVTFRFAFDSGGTVRNFAYLDRIETIVPEPSTLALFGLGGLYLVNRARRKR